MQARAMRIGPCFCPPDQRALRRHRSRIESAAATEQDAAAMIKERTMIHGISAVTLATHDMRRAVRFYRLLELPVVHGGEEAGFTSFRAGDNFLNLIAQPAERGWSWWGRLIFYHPDVRSEEH